MPYFSYTRPDALAVEMDSSTTTVELVDGSSLPDPALPGVGQYTVIIGYGSSREEVCTVTAKPTARILTVIRGEDGTLATAKNQGDVVVHGVSARDFNEISNKLPLAGGQMTGPLLLVGSPVADLEAATRAWTLSQIAAQAYTRTVVSTAVSITAGSLPHTDYVYLCTATLTVTLPDPATVTGRQYTVKNRASPAGVVTVVGVVDGGTNFVVDVVNQSVDLVSTGTDWVIV